MAAVEDGHIVLLGHLVDGVEEAQEVLLRVDVLLAVGAQQDVLALLQAQAGVDVAGLDLGEVVVQHLRHRRAGDVGALLRQAAVGQVAAGVLGVGHIHIGDDVHDAAVGLLRQALVLAAVAGLHVEDGDVQPLGADDAEAGVGVAQHQHGIGLHLHHQLVALGDDVAHRLAQVLAHGLHIHVRVGELQVLEEHAVEVVVIVLPGVRQQAVEILAALVDDRRQADDLRARADDDQKLQLPVILELCPYLLFHRFKIGIRFIRIEDLVAVHHGHQVLGVGEVDDVVGVAGEHVDGLDVVAGDLPFQDLAFGVVEVPLLDEAVALDHDELLELGVVPVLALGDAGLGDVDGDLAGIQGMHELGEGAAVIDIHLQREGHLLLGEIAQVGRIQLLCKAPVRNLRNHQRLGLVREGMQQVHDLAQGRLVRRRHIAVAAVLHREHAQPVELAAVLLPAQAGDHLVHQVVDIQQLQLHRRVIDRIRQVIGNRVAERRDGAVVVGPAPFAEEVREAVHQHFGACVLAVLEEQILPRLLAAAVLGVPETARQRSLLARRQHHRARIPMLPQRIQQGRCEPEIPAHELSRILRPVHPREVEHEVRLRAPAVQLLRRGIEVVLEHLVNGHAIVPGLSVPDILQLRAEVLAHEPFAPVTSILITSRYSESRSAHSGCTPARRSSPSSPRGSAASCCRS